MRIQLRLSLMIALSSMSLAQSGTREVYSLQVAPAVPMADLIAAVSGHGLTLTECVDRVEHLDTLLRDRGYGARRDDELEPGVLVTRWYRPGTHTAVLAWMHANGAAHDLELAEFTWNHPWGDWLTPF